MNGHKLREKEDRFAVMSPRSLKNENSAILRCGFANGKEM